MDGGDATILVSSFRLRLQMEISLPLSAFLPAFGGAEYRSTGPCSSPGYRRCALYLGMDRIVASQPSRPLCEAAMTRSDPRPIRREEVGSAIIKVENEDTVDLSCSTTAIRSNHRVTTSLLVLSPMPESLGEVIVEYSIRSSRKVQVAIWRLSNV